MAVEPWIPAAAAATCGPGGPGESTESHKSRGGGSRRKSVSSGMIGCVGGWEERTCWTWSPTRKQVGILLAVCELSEEFMEDIKKTLEGMREKAGCNAAINEAVSVETLG